MPNSDNTVLYPSIDEIICSLLYCTCCNGIMCEKCPYAVYGSECSYLLFTNTARLLYEAKEDGHENA